jgi:hypothetical protein
VNEVVVRKDEPFAKMGKIIDATTPCLQFSARQSVIRAMRQRVQTAIEVLAGLDELNAQWEKKAIALLKIGVGVQPGGGCEDR